MKAESFCYWMQGFFEIGGVRAITEDEAKIIQAHLNMVFIHDIDPKMGNKEHQQLLNIAHNGTGNPTLQELLPNHTVHINAGPEIYTDGRLKPFGWTEDWEYSTLHGWYNPKEGTPRC
jgi:hypothetical protein